jgi:hypothetical protein
MSRTSLEASVLPPAVPRAVAAAVPARNEVMAIGICLAALDQAARVAEGPVTVVVLVNNSGDATAANARAFVPAAMTVSVAEVDLPAAGAPPRHARRRRADRRCALCSLHTTPVASGRIGARSRRRHRASGAPASPPPRWRTRSRWPNGWSGGSNAQHVEAIVAGPLLVHHRRIRRHRIEKRLHRRLTVERIIGRRSEPVDQHDAGIVARHPRHCRGHVADAVAVEVVEPLRQHDQVEAPRRQRLRQRR